MGVEVRVEAIVEVRVDNLQEEVGEDRV